MLADPDPHLASSSDVIPIHCAVPGRVRFRVAGLRNGQALARTIERGLLAAAGVKQVSASPLTGNVLVLHDESALVPELARRIGALKRGEITLADEDDAPPFTWHTMEAEDVAEALGTSRLRGLSKKECRQRLASEGANSIPSLHGRSDWSIFIEQFQGLPVALLAGAAVVSLATGGLLEASAILAVVGLNAAIGFGVEKRTEQIISRLGGVGAKTAHVIRSGREIEVPAANMVRGDVMVLQRGSVVPADGRLMRAEMLMTSEAALTGESQPVEKSVPSLADPNVALADRHNMVYRGAVVTGGSGIALVVATGRHTEMGRVQRLVGVTARPETPSTRQMDELGQQLVWVTLGATGVIFATGLLRGLALLQLVRSSLALAVSAVPEGLPMVATTALALGVEKLRREGILVRRLEAIETLASVNVICFDKTGTLTHGTMSLDSVAIGNRIWRSRDGALIEIDGAPESGTEPSLARLLSIMSLCSDAKLCRSGQRIEINGSSTESGLVEAALANGVDVARLRLDHPRRAVQHRTETYRFMITQHDAPAGFLIAMKGSPAEVLARCKWEMDSTGARKLLTPDRRVQIEALNHRLAQQGLRMLAAACLETGEAVEIADLVDVADLVWVGLAGLSDPVRSDVQVLMQKLRRAGIHPVMLTGDQRDTAKTIGNEVGLSGNSPLELIDGTELDRLDPAQLKCAARRAHVFARVTPSQKLKIVAALQHGGAVVAMVGDGINDSPALRAANVGIAIGRNGDSAAREVADIFLANDQIGALTIAIACGRATHVNVRKALHYILSTNASEILLVLAATAAGVGAILTPVQLLWINLVSDVLPGIGLAMGEPDPDAMDDAPIAADASILKREDFKRLAREAGLMTAGACGAGLIAAARYGAASSQVSTMTFGSLVTGQLLHAFTYTRTGAEARHRPLSSNRNLLGIVVGSLLLQALAMLVPGLRRVLGVTQVGAADVVAMIAGGVLPYLANNALGSDVTRLRTNEIGRMRDGERTLGASSSEGQPEAGVDASTEKPSSHSHRSPTGHRRIAATHQMRGRKRRSRI